MHKKIIGLALGVGMFVLTVPAFAQVPSCSSGIGSPLLVDVTQAITNDPDSSEFDGTTWALDNFTRHIQIWQEDTHYCAQADDVGTFTTNGTISPKSGSSLPLNITGTFTGNTHGEIDGTFDAQWSTSGSAPAEDNQSGLTDLWLQNYFDSGATYDYGSRTDGWSWTYATTDNGTWVNQNAGNTGDIGLVADVTTGIGYGSIQAAVDAANPGDSIKVSPGTYDESVLINKPLTLQATIHDGTATSTITGLGSGQNYIVKIEGTNNVSVDGFEINGGGVASGSNAFDYGVWVNDAGTISGQRITLTNLTVKNIWNTGANGIEIDASGPGGSFATINHSTISSFDKRGVRFINSSGDVYGNNVIGDNVDGTSRVQNLINLWGGSDVAIYDNQLHNALTTPGSTPTWDSPGIFVSSYDAGTSANPSHADIHGNEIYNDDTGITLGSFYVSGTDASTAAIHDNTFHDVNVAINLEKGDVTATVHNNSFGLNVASGITSDDANGGPTPPASVDATENWWGDTSGPDATTNPGLGASVYDEVSFSPWFSDEDMTTLRYTTTTSGGEASTTVSTEVNESQSTPNGDIDVVIPAGTVVTGPDTWDGTINPPTVTTTTVAPIADSGNTATVIGSIEIGFGDTLLTFDKAVQIVFMGQAGNSVGYSHGAGTFHQITAVCAGANDEAIQTANLGDGEECKIVNDGSGNLVVWTKHFSTFTTYTQSATPSSGSTSGGGGGGSGAGSYTNSSPVGNNGGGTFSTGGVAAAGPVTSTGGGEVLGAESHKFTANLGFGTKGSEITELQKALIGAGFDIPLITKSGVAYGYFGSQTFAAVKAFQKAHGIIQTGFVGPLTRGALNAL